MTKTEEYLKLIAEQLILLNKNIQSLIQKPKAGTYIVNDNCIGSTGEIKSEI